MYRLIFITFVAHSIGISSIYQQLLYVKYIEICEQMPYFLVVIVGYYDEHGTVVLLN
tara:strand:+ start:508 stop:678 length:171 start_codon:yes stop_codon:yes gene_type:complete